MQDEKLSERESWSGDDASEDGRASDNDRAVDDDDRGGGNDPPIFCRRDRYRNVETFPVHGNVSASRLSEKRFQAASFQ